MPLAALLGVGRNRRHPAHRDASPACASTSTSRARSRSSEVLVRTLGGRVGNLGQLVHGEAELRRNEACMLFLHDDEAGLAIRDRDGAGPLPARRSTRAAGGSKKSPGLAKLVMAPDAAVERLAGQALDSGAHASCARPTSRDARRAPCSSLRRPLLSTLFVCARADAYCRTKACDTEPSYGDVWDEEPQPTECVRNDQGCFIQGTPLFWPSTCVSFAVAELRLEEERDRLRHGQCSHRRGLREVGGRRLRRRAARAFAS